MAEPRVIDDEVLRGYLSESLPAGEMALVEKALRDSAELRDRLEDVRQDRTDAGLHTLGAIWRRNRLSCPNRQDLGSYMLEVLDPAQADYIAFHLDVVACAYCRANLDDLERQASEAAGSMPRHKRIFQSSRHLLGGET
ncbi:hypothetical protein BH23PLA1_BH23PLA1_18460 [soil metagenome]